MHDKFEPPGNAQKGIASKAIVTCLWRKSRVAGGRLGMGFVIVCSLAVFIHYSSIRANLFFGVLDRLTTPIER